MSAEAFEKNKKQDLDLLRIHVRAIYPKADAIALDAIVETHLEAIGATSYLTLAIAKASAPRELNFKLKLHKALRADEIMPFILKYVAAKTRLKKMMDSYEELYSSDWDNSDDANNCCVCDAMFSDECRDNLEQMGDGEKCYYCSGRVCPDCIDHDAPHAIGRYELEAETVCKSCCKHEVKLRADKEQAEEDESIAAFEDHPK